jgi:phosphatidylserine/phosphatidylglycerophosphate/cardiolipin synthase-like enzyme
MVVKSMKHLSFRMLLLSVLCSIVCIPLAQLIAKEPIDYIKLAYQTLIVDDGINPYIRASLFVPKDPVEAVLIGLIDNEQVSIHAALYQLTNGNIAAALIRAHERGVIVEIVSDYSCLIADYEKLTLLQRSDIPVYIFREKLAIMHNKFFVFARNIFDRPIIWTGSANATRSGLNKNCENVTVSDTLATWQLYADEFVRLKKITVLAPQQTEESWWNKVVEMLPNF